MLNAYIRSSAYIGSSFSIEKLLKDKDDLRVQRGGTAPVLPCSFFSVCLSRSSGQFRLVQHMPACRNHVPWKKLRQLLRGRGSGGTRQSGRVEAVGCSGLPPGLAAWGQPP